MGLSKNESALKARLDKEVAFRNDANEVSEERLDPILIARLYNEEYSSLVCALFAYGKVESIVKFLRSLEMGLLDADEALIREKLQNHYYRFQNSEDIMQFFITLSRLKKEGSLNDFFLQGYKEQNCAIAGVNTLIEKMQQVNGYKSRGYDFLIAKVTHKRKGAGAMKRWHMYLRWMVRHDSIDMGLWQGVDKKDLILPLDTHTFNMGHRLGLLKRKSYDLEAAWELTQKLRSFDNEDPVKYDFALYRLGQES
ncbi:MAG: TIGR02757 family protein [Campylobacterales bacterium]|nr:TIGR02757 family protein [Campylobacterales bacterium]